MVQYSEGMRKFASHAIWLQLLAAVGSITTMCMIICCYGRTVPLNFILLTIFTLCEGFMVATITARYDTKTVVTAGLATALTTISLTIYAMFTKVDIQVFYALLFVIYLAMFPLMLIGMFVIRCEALRVFYCCLGLLFYSIFLIVDTMLIVRNNKSAGGYEVSYDDYVIGALQLYLDIVMIFLYILQLLGGGRD